MSEAKLQDASFRSLLEAAPDGILLVERSGRIALVNATCARLMGYQADELVGQMVELVVPEYIRPKHAALRDAYFASPRPRPMGIGLELKAASKTGLTIPVEISLSPFTHEDFVGAIAIVRDVTEQRQLLRELKRSNEDLEQFAYVASHDLQEPLRMVAGYTQLLQRRYAGRLDQDANEYIGFAVDGVKRMQALINDLLTYSRLTTRAKPFAEVALADVFAQVEANLKAVLQETSAVLTTGPLPKVIGDRVQLTQLLQNLISNAIKFRRDDTPPKVHISAKEEAQGWTISVEDNGIGLDAQYAEKIFVIFQRLHTREKYPGTGIGLALCKKIVERHFGKIWVESLPDKGSTFYFTLQTKGL